MGKYYFSVKFPGRCSRGIDTSLDGKVMSAIQNGDTPNLENLLDVLCADVNAVANNGYTALIISAYNGQKSAVKLLIER